MNRPAPPTRPALPPIVPIANIPTKKIKLSKDKAILERHVEGDNYKYAKSKGVTCEKFTAPSRRSVPDRMFTFPYSLIVFIEYKRPKGRATVKQFEDHQKRRALGILVYVIDNAKAGRWLIDKLLKIAEKSAAVREQLIFDELEDNRKTYVNEKSVTRISK